MTGIELGFLILVAAAVVIVLGAFLKGMKEISGAIKGFFKLLWAVIKSPLKGISTIKAARLERKIKKATKKFEKALMAEDYKARLNTAKQNPSYLAAKSVEKPMRKVANLEAKRK